MEQIFYSSDSVIIYYSAIVITLGIAAGLFFSYSLYASAGGNRLGYCVMIIPAVFLSVIFSRILHWYCHAEQYSSLYSALTNYANGGFVLSGVFAGVILAVLLVRLLRLCDSAARLFDCLAPGMCLTFSFIRLSSLFNYSCRSKISIENADYQRLPFAASFTDAGGVSEYRFAVFFAEFVVLLILFILITVFYFRHSSEKSCEHGSTANMFISWYSAIEMMADSTRYDSSFAQFNGFISVVQMVCAAILVFVLVFYSIRYVKKSGIRCAIPLWVLFLVALGITGVSEYLVQRHGNWYLSCYFAMAIGCFGMAGINDVVRRRAAL